jgi:hypothetical protein
MSFQRVKNNLGFLIAGAILFGVAVNVYYELGITGGKEPECLSTSTFLHLRGR